MFFTPSANSRRSARGTVLDVKLRSQSRRAHRWRLFFLTTTALVTVAAGYSLGGRGWEWLRQHAFYANQAFALNTIDVETDGWITPEQVRQWSGVRLGDNLLAIDLDRVRRDLELIPQVERAVVECVLPHLLRLRVVERQPVALVKVLRPDGNGGLTPGVFYLDAGAVAIPPLAQAQPNPVLMQALAALPAVRGVPASELRAGQPVNVPGLRAALRLLGECEHSSMAGAMDLQGLDISQPGVLVAATHQGAEITFGLESFETQLRRWRMVHDAGARQGRRVASLDLSVSNNCPLLWLEASATLPSRPKPPKFLPNRKKHV
jgi:hypothetical protein